MTIRLRGVRPTHGRRWPSPRRHRRRPAAARLMPRDTLTSSAPPRTLAPGGRVAAPLFSTASRSPAWAPSPGTRKGSAGRRSADLRHLARRRGAHHEAHVRGVAGPFDRAPRNVDEERRAAGERQVLELRRARIGRPAQDVHEAIVALEERSQGIAAQVWIGGDRVGAERVEERHGLPRDGIGDVAALGVGDDRHVRRDGGPDPLEGSDAGAAERLEEGDVDLDRGCGRGGRFDQQARETLHARQRRARSPPAGRPDRDRRPGRAHEPTVATASVEPGQVAARRAQRSGRRRIRCWRRLSAHSCHVTSRALALKIDE